MKAYLKLCVRTADLPEAPVRSSKRKCLMCGNTVWSDPKADIPILGVPLHICEHCLPAVLENHLSDLDEVEHT